MRWCYTIDFNNRNTYFGWYCRTLVLVRRLYGSVWILYSSPTTIRIERDTIDLDIVRYGEKADFFPDL